MRHYGLLLVVATIFAMGLVMIFSTTSAEVLDHDLDRSLYHSFVRQIFYALVGIGMGYGVWKMGYRDLLKASPLLLIFFTVMLVLVLIPGVGREINGSRRWLSLGGLSFQPSEFVKYAVPAFFIYELMQWKEHVLPLRIFLLWVGITLVPIGLILIEPNNGTAAVVAVSLVVVFFLARLPAKMWALPLLIVALVGGVSASQLPYIKARIKVYMNPELDIQGKGHQPLQAKIAAGSGQLFGKGPGQSMQKLSYLPEAQNDYIAAIFAEEFGFVGMVILILLYTIFICIGFSIAFHAPDRAGFLLAGAVTFLISFQAFMNLGVVSGLLPSTGLNLPWFSQGGSSLMANMAGVGILLSIQDRFARKS
jgi:cell division protein FtsW